MTSQSEIKLRNKHNLSYSALNIPPHLGSVKINLNEFPPNLIMVKNLEVICLVVLEDV